MDCLKKYCNFRANSILESVIALSIISVCLYFAVMIFAAVFTSKTSSNFYGTQNKVNEMFYLIQLNNDSLINASLDNNLEIKQNSTNQGVKEINLKYKDSSKFEFYKNFYIQSINE